MNKLEAPTPQLDHNLKYQLHQRVIYPGQGICEVISIEEKNIVGINVSFYILRVENSNRKIMVPVMNVDAVGLRPLASETQIREIFEILNSSQELPPDSNWPKRVRYLAEKIKNGTMKDLAEIVCTMMKFKQCGHKLSWSETRMLREAKDLLIQEIAASRKQTIIQVETEIEAIFAVK